MLETTTLGKTGITVPRLCFGSWQAFGWATSDDNNFKRTLCYALERGINFIDTAEAYGEGHAEKLIGETISGRRDKVIIATKFWYQRSKPAELRLSLEGSLKRLKTDYVDLYQQHWPPLSPPLDETINELVKLKEAGKIRAVGVSNWMEPEWNEIKNPELIDCLQPCYSLLWRSVEKNVLPFCLKHRIAVIPYSPLCQGVLAGRFQSAEAVPNDFRKKNRLFAAEFFPCLLEVVKAVKEIAQELQKPMAAVALRWLLEQPGVTAPIVGASNSTQVDENLQALGWKMPKEHIERLDKLSSPLSAGLKPHETMWNWHPRGA